MAIDKKRKARAESHTKKVKKRKEEREMEMIEHRRIAYFYKNRHLLEGLLPKTRTSYLHKIEKRPNDHHTVPIEKIIDQPTTVTGILKDHQLKGLAFLIWLNKNGLNGILGDEMGLGATKMSRACKTLQTLSLLAYVKEEGVTKPSLVVCPLSVMDTWLNEAKRWVPSMTVFAVHGHEQYRRKLKDECLANGKEYDIYITTYEQYVTEQAWFRMHFKWNYVILDEGHRIRTSTTNVAKALHGIYAHFKLLLTGTPIQNDLTEIWGLFHWLYKDIFTDETANEFRKSFNLDRGTYNLDFIETTRSLLQNIMIRRTKMDLETESNFQLPPKEEITLYLPLSPMQQFWYLRLIHKLDSAVGEKIFDSKAEEQLEPANQEAFKEMVENVEYKEAEQTGTYQKMMNLLMQLRKACLHPYLFDGAEPLPHICGEHLVFASSKLIILDKILQKCQKEKKQTLIFSGFTRILDIVQDYMNMRQFRYARLDGKTSRPRRALDIRLFQKANSIYDHYLISTGAGSLGITLTAATVIIFLDHSIDLQALARAHRIGQTKPVTIYRLVMQDTVEDQMMTRIRRKLYLSLKMDMKGTTANDGSVNPLSTTELINMLRSSAAILADEVDADSVLKFERWIASDLDEVIAVSKRISNQREEAISSRNEDEEETTIVSGRDAEEKYLRGIAKVNTRMFRGQEIRRAVKAPSEEWQELAKRVSTARTTKVGGHDVLKNSLGCATWEAASCFTSGKTVGEVKLKRPRKEFQHQDWCFVCNDGGDLGCCDRCPRAYHYECHDCGSCSRSTADAGGMLFRCQKCPNAFCDACLSDDTHLVGAVIPELLLMDYDECSQAYYIHCNLCVTLDKRKPAEVRTFEAEQKSLWKQVQAMEDAQSREEEEAREAERQKKAKALQDKLDIQAAIRKEQWKMVRVKRELEYMEIFRSRFDAENEECERMMLQIDFQESRDLRKWVVESESVPSSCSDRLRSLRSTSSITSSLFS